MRNLAEKMKCNLKKPQEYKKRGFSPNPDPLNCERHPELRKLKRGSDPL